MTNMIAGLEPGTVLGFLAASAVLVAVPGPNHVYILTRTLGQGRRAGLASAAGVESGTLLHVAAAALGISALVAASPTALTLVKLGGVAYLLYLGIRAVRTRGEPQPAGDVPPQPLRRVYLDGVVVNVLNPKVALFFLAFLPQFVTAGADAATARLQMILLGIALSLVGLASDVAYALLAGGARAWLRRRRTSGGRGRYLVAGVYTGLAGFALAS